MYISHDLDSSRRGMVANNSTYTPLQPIKTPARRNDPETNLEVESIPTSQMRKSCAHSDILVDVVLALTLTIKGHSSSGPMRTGHQVGHDGISVAWLASSSRRPLRRHVELLESTHWKCREWKFYYSSATAEALKCKDVR